MLFQSKQIKGEGRGHGIGFPTINLAVPLGIDLEEGIYAVWVGINEDTYKGALHYGLIPTFDQNEKTLEVYLLDIADATVPDTTDALIEIDVVKRLREVRKFENASDLAIQIGDDVEKIRTILK